MIPLEHWHILAFTKSYIAGTDAPMMVPVHVSLHRQSIMPLK